LIFVGEVLETAKSVLAAFKIERMGKISDHH